MGKRLAWRLSDRWCTGDCRRTSNRRRTGDRRRLGSRRRLGRGCCKVVDGGRHGAIAPIGEVEC